jgi:hypothetical protein
MRPAEPTYRRFIGRCSFNLDDLPEELGTVCGNSSPTASNTTVGRLQVASWLLQEFGVPQIPQTIWHESWLGLS